MTDPLKPPIRARIQQQIRSWWGDNKPPRYSDGELKEVHDETSRTVRKTLMSIIGFSLFCLFVLGQPDKSLIAADATVKLPFADVPVSYSIFLIVAPIILLAFTYYLHVFVGWWVVLSRSPNIESITRLPFIFNLPYRGPRLMSMMLLYGLPSLMLGVFAWKTLPLPNGALFQWAFLLSSAVMYVIFYRRHINPDKGLIEFNVVALFIAAGATVIPFPSRSLDLRKANLQHQDLNGVVLTRADMEEARLDSATLTGANFTGAILTGAHFTGANLTGANFTKAILLRVDFRETILDGANFSEAIWVDGTRCAARSFGQCIEAPP